MPQSIPPGLKPEHVLRAIADLDGGTAHTFGDPTKYELVHIGKRYAPKAVVGLACQYSIGRILAPDEFSGGEAPGQANFVLRKLGFTVVRKDDSTSEDEGTAHKDWSEQEVRLIVADYFANHIYPLKLTQQQRETLLEHTSLSGKLKKKIEQAGEGTQIVPVTWNELHKLNDETGQAAVYARSPHKKRLLAVMSRVVKFFGDEHAEVFDLDAPTPAKRRPAKSDLLFQFKITLVGVKPPIWRRIQVKDCSLDKLHEHIQTSMGWTNSHLHRFQIGEQQYADPMLMEEDFEEMAYEDSTTTMLSDIVPKGGKRLQFVYEYDFGDSWDHEVVFEGCPKVEAGRQYPICLEGERACPPEDVGGVGGYADFLEAIRDKDHEEREAMLEWDGGWFDPEEFNATTATKSMKKGLPDWRSEV